MTYNCIIIDDEPPARKILEKYLSNFPQLTLVAACSNAFEAMQLLQHHRIDLIFLDINMPKLSGINFLKSLNHPPLVIFTTAYPEFAIEGFELEATDYLLKPFSLERFTKAVFKATQQLDLATKLTPPAIELKPSILIKADKKLYKVNQEDILYLEAYGDYVKVHTKEGVILPKKKLSEYREELEKEWFLKIHRSYIVNLQYIAYIEGNRVKVGKAYLPISQGYRQDLLDILHS